MTARTRGPLVAAALALAAPALAHDPAPGDPGGGRAPQLADGALDLHARVRSIPGGVTLELGGTLLELRFTEGPPPPGGAAPAGARELRATIAVDGRERGLVLRLVPPPPAGGDL